MKIENSPVDDMNNTFVTIDSLYLGKVQKLWPDKEPSAIAKTSTSSLQYLTKTGFSGDQQADLSVHGGEDKAVHHYAADHYPYWQSMYGAGPVFCAGGFGENVSTTGLTEAAVCIGDIFKLGAATVQISQGRQPCWKLNEHTATPSLASQFRKTGKTGWYYRVLEEGEVQQGQSLQLLERPNPVWSVETVTRARLTRKISTSEAKALSELPELAKDWRDTFDEMS